MAATVERRAGGSVSGKAPVLLSWSGGKDSCVALYLLQRSSDYEVTSLITTVTSEYDRISMHGVRIALLDQQGAALELPVDQIVIPPAASNTVYEAAVATALRRHAAHGVRTIAFGDLFLEEIKSYRERMMAPLGMDPIFPVWGRETRRFLEDFIAAGFRAIIVCVDLSALDASFAGRLLDADLLAALPAGVDPCGENGEFHTFVFDGPNFKAPIAFEIGERVIRDGFCFCDLVPAA